MNKYKYKNQMPLRCDVLRIYSTHRVENSIEIHHANRLLDTYLSVSIEERFVVRFLCSPSRLRLTKLPLKKNMFQSVCGQTTRNVKSIWRNLHTKASLFTTLTLNKHCVGSAHQHMYSEGTYWLLYGRIFRVFFFNCFTQKKTTTGDFKKSQPMNETNRKKRKLTKKTSDIYIYVSFLAICDRTVVV